MPTDVYFFVAITAGIIPALFWLWFWLREDRERPEPWELVAISFLSGMAVVPLVLPLQKLAIDLYAGQNLVFVWVIIEEVAKYSIALLVVLWNRAVDEPIDMIMYMIFVALGFSALENALYLYTPLVTGEIERSLFTGGFRFLGATLLHVLASATIGVCMAFAFYKGTATKLLYGTVGLCMAIVLHALFNFSIMESSGDAVLLVFLFVWIGIVILFLLFEKIKQLQTQSL